MKTYAKDLVYLYKIFGKSIPKWMLDKIWDVEERTGNIDLSQINLGRIWL